MPKKLIPLLCLSVAVVLVLYVCQSMQKPKFTVSPVEMNIHELTTCVYSDEELEELVELCNDKRISLDELNKNYPIECARDLSNQYSEDYAVYYCGTGRYVGVMIHAEENTWYITNAGLIDASYDLAYYESRLVVGMPLFAVEKLDPNGSYPFHHAGTTMSSVHITTDGYRIVVTYSYESGTSDAVIEHIDVSLL